MIGIESTTRLKATDASSAEAVRSRSSLEQYSFSKLEIITKSLTGFSTASEIKSTDWIVAFNDLSDLIRDVVSVLWGEDEEEEEEGGIE